MTVDYRAELARLQEAQRDLAKDIDAIRAEWAGAWSVKVGDVVNANRYTYKGQPMKVFCVTVKPDWNDKWKFLATGHVLNKDGTPGKREAEYEESAS
jgi:hypothetical protein